MLKKVLLSFFILVLGTFSVNNVMAISEDNPYLDRLDESTLKSLEIYVDSFGEFNIELVSESLVKIDFAIQNTDDLEQKYILNFLKYELNIRLEELTGLKVEKLDLLDKWLSSNKISTLKKVVKILDDLKEKYQESEKKLNIIYFLKYKIKNIIEYRVENSCVYKGEYFLKNNYINKSKKTHENGFETWLVCNLNTNIIMRFNYTKKNGDISKNNEYRGKDVIFVYEKVYTVEYLIKNYDVYKKDGNKKIIITEDGEIIEPEDGENPEYDKNTSEDCNDNYMKQFGNLYNDYICRYSSSMDEESGEEIRNGDDTLMNKSQTSCYLL
ncbi:MAG: hypothetical protein Q9M94_04575 [Candidatus Gracilibacteria bacterium]|nr:hypothetical protein [Candidatus Gracilibacteria bacterium]